MDGVILPDAEWRRQPGLDLLANTLRAEGGEARFVGGAVRDTLLGLPVADVDLATTHAPDKATALLALVGIKTVPTGIAHGTVTAILEGGTVEVTTLRRDVSTDGRRATVAFTDDWREDAARRDFTINALYADPASGQVHDYFDGLLDLEARRIRFIGDPYQRIAEDHLRILRFFRFLARFGDAPDPQGLEACSERANDLMALSRERIADELLKLLAAKDAVRVVQLMVEHNIFVPVLPEITSSGVDRLARLAEREAMGIEPDAIRRLAALLPNDPAVGEVIANRLKLSKVQRRRLTAALAPDADLIEGDELALAYRVGLESAIDQLLLHGSAGKSVRLHKAARVPAFPLTGGAVVSRGVRAGPEVARLLRVIEDQWVAEGFPDMARAEAIADAAVAQALGSNKSR